MTSPPVYRYHRIRNLDQWDDPVIHHVLWTPATTGGVFHRTHRLVQFDQHQAGFRASMEAQAIWGGLVVVGILAWMGGFSPDASTELWQRLGGLVLIGWSLWRLYRAHVPIRFDKQHGYFSCGWRVRKKAPDGMEVDRAVALKRIYALQLVSKPTRLFRNEGQEIDNFELNLVLTQGIRMPVVAHSNLLRLRADAAQLGQFLDVPVWDAV
ncbi:hypothetical protein SAMN05421823_11331 [Catalinimonas alkaloidigena]|uniref:Uncharacterized protein n=1 Tax=Catalinimonas alkaloidigena TaxID=1075417 RepID=A0A1G9SZY8_9BACT|nr:hypothetical protein [Catalinimonas alkaloidigena]SDM40405.1 hypothetical protein SAMN05421823_11331 [Catalinimonas alkaloidigena]